MSAIINRVERIVGFNPRHDCDDGDDNGVENEDGEDDTKIRFLSRPMLELKL